MSRFFKLLPFLAVGFLLTVATGAVFVSGADASTVTFSDFDDVDKSSTNFDISNTIWIESDSKLVIGLNNFMANEFSNIARDGIGFTITAADGYVISKISYFESLVSVGDSGMNGATGMLTLNGTEQHDLGYHVFQLSGSTDTWTLGKENILSEDVSEVSISIANSLFSFGTNAQITKTSAYLIIETTSVPVPPATWLLGCGLIGLLGIRRRRLNQE